MVEESSSSILSRRHSEDCWGCRIISGGGLIGIGVYLLKQNNTSRPPLARTLLLTLATCSAGFGVARLANLPPFRKLEAPET